MHVVLNKPIVIYNNIKLMATRLKPTNTKSTYGNGIVIPHAPFKRRVNGLGSTGLVGSVGDQSAGD